MRSERFATGVALLFLALGARAASCPSYGPLPGAPADYAQALERFARYRASKETGIRAEGDLPFLRTHGAPTDDAVLLVHGLSDSPYYVATIADALYDRGFNVVSVLLPGHGTQPECLLHVKKEEWRQEVQFGLSLTRRLGRRVSMAGFSTGGALSLDAVAHNYAAARGDQIPWGNLFLFSPAIGFDGVKTDLCALADVLEKVRPWKGNNPDAPETNPYKYAKMATNAVCQLRELTQDNFFRRGSIGREIAAHGIGVFAVESMADTAVSPEAVVRFVDGLPAGVRKELISYPKGEAIAHAAVPRPETNPHYAAMIAALGEFVAASSAAPPPARPAPSSAVMILKARDWAAALTP